MSLTVLLLLASIDGVDGEIGKGAVYVTLGSLLGGAVSYLVTQWTKVRAQSRADHKQDEAEQIAGLRELIERYKMDRRLKDQECHDREAELQAEVDNQRLWVQWLTVRSERAVTRMEFMEDDMRKAGLEVRKWVEPPMPSGLQRPAAPFHLPLPTTKINVAGEILPESPGEGST